MARIRTIKPEFWTDSLMVQLPHLTRLIYIALWNAADDHGFIRNEPERLAMELMPREPFEEFDKALQLLIAADRVLVHGTADGSTYLEIAHWAAHQRVDHPAKSKISREDSRKLAIPLRVRREVAQKYGCAPGAEKKAQCFYCGAGGTVYWHRHADGRPSSWVVFPGLELDHVEAESSDGENKCENIVLACRFCNRSKGQKHWHECLKLGPTDQWRESSRESSRTFALEQGTGNREQGKENSVCPEPADAASAPTFHAEPPVLEITTNTGKPYPIHAALIADWQRDFPGIDVEAQLRRARAWVDATPARRKTAAGMKRFLVGWLGRAQDGAGRSAPQIPQPRQSLVERAAQDDLTARSFLNA